MDNNMSLRRATHQYRQISNTSFRKNKTGRSRQKMLARRINAYLTLRAEPDQQARSVTDDDVSDWPKLKAMLVQYCAVFAGDKSVNGRMMAAAQLGPHTTLDAVSDMTVVEVFTTAYEGSLEDCSTILDVHYRLLAETLIKGDTELVREVYEKFARLPPRLRKSSLRATAACAEAGLLHTREEYEIMNNFLCDVVESGEADEEAVMEYERNCAMLKAMDDMLEAMLANVSDW